MDISRGPTDNLYKFIALSGVALVCLGVVFANNLYSSWVTANIDAGVSAEAVNAHKEAVLVAMDRRSDVLLQKIDSLYTAGDVETLRELRSDQLELSEKWLEDARQLNSSAVDARIKTDTVLAIERSFRGRMFVYSGMILVGAVLAAIGFRLWYQRLQRFLDAKVRSEGE